MTGRGRQVGAKFVMALALGVFAVSATVRAEPLDEKLRRFESFWGANLPVGCGRVSASKVAKIDDNDQAIAAPVRELHTRLLFQGGVASWGTARGWNIALLEDVALSQLVTPDAIDFMLCHELGHYRRPAPATGTTSVNAQELLADRYALDECLPKFWRAGREDREYKERAAKAVESGMAYFHDFLKHRALGAGAGDFKEFECRKKTAGLALRREKMPACVGKLFGEGLVRSLR